jgi:RHS repeat-associated protein
VVAAGVLLVGAGATAVAGTDTTGSNIALNGSDGLARVTQAVIASCAAQFGDFADQNITYLGGGSGAGVGKMIADNQQIAPMSRALSSDEYCGSSSGLAENLLIGLDGVAVVANEANSCSVTTANGVGSATAFTVTSDGTSTGGAPPTCPGCDGSGKYTFADSFDALKVLYFGLMHDGTYDCASPVRRSLIRNWHNVFTTDCPAGDASCTGGLTHVWRRGDLAGDTDSFVRVLNPTGRGLGTLANSPSPVKRTNPFCNSVDATSSPPGVSYAGDADFQDQDPIRTKCTPSDGVCEAFPNFGTFGVFRGDLGVVLPIVLPDSTSTFDSDVYPTRPCSGGCTLIAPIKGNQIPANFLCPDGTSPLGGFCYVPYAGDSTNPDPRCVNSQFNRCVSAIGKVDGRVYNMPVIVQAAQVPIRYRAPSAYQYAVDANGRMLTRSFFRIHSLAAGANNVPETGKGATGTCRQFDDTSQIGCLVDSDPCSVGYAARRAAAVFPGLGDDPMPFPEPLKALAINGIAPFTPGSDPDLAIRNLLKLPGTTPLYPMAHRMYLSTTYGFGNLLGGEKELTQCFAMDNVVSAAVSQNGMVPIPGGVQCLDYPERASTSTPSPNVQGAGNVALPGCGAATGTNACAASPVPIQVSSLPPVSNLPITDLGTPVAGGTSSATAVNSKGEVVGSGWTIDGPTQAAIWPVGGSVIDVGTEAGFLYTSTAYAVNNGGTVTGSTVGYDGLSHVFSLSPSQVFSDLGYFGDASTLGSTFTRGAYGYAINDFGQIAGVYTTGHAQRAFIYTPGSGFMDIGSLGGTTWAQGISNTGTVVGSSQVSGPSASAYANYGHAIAYEEGVGLVDLNNFVDPTSGVTLIQASAIAQRYVVGGASQSGGPAIPFRFNLSTEEVQTIASPWAGDTYALAVNNLGEMVGTGATDAGNQNHAAFFYSDQLGFRNLNDLLPAGTGWFLYSANGINDSGDVVGWGYHNGTPKAFVMKVTPQAVACSNQGSSPVCIWLDGVVDQGAGKYMAVFGYQNTTGSTITPTSNQELVNGQAVPNPYPAPPAQLPAGTYPGAFLPTFSVNDSMSWTVNGQTVTAYAPFARQLTTFQLGQTGSAIEIEDTQVAVSPDTTQYGIPPQFPPVGPNPQLGNQYFGSLKGTLTVSPSGGATYNLPITVPPGVAGMTPSVSLTYNSQAGDGIAGQGWSLTGLSAIHRCAKTRVQDGNAQPIHMDIAQTSGVTDGLCLDGKRLINLSDTTYRLESADFSTITASNSHNTFTITTKSGEVHYYGLRPESRVILPSFGNDVPNEIVIWGLDRVEDRWGNYYDVHYNNGGQSFGSLGLIVTSIQYTGHHDSNGDCGSSPTNICPPNTITFGYDPSGRPDVRQSHFHLSTLFASQRLKTITTPLGTYTLNYLDPDPMLPSRLGNIGYQALSTPAFPNPPPLDPINFTWDAGSYGWLPAPLPGAVGQGNSYALPVPLNLKNSKASGVQFVDLDGDGRADLIESRDASSDGTYAAASRAWHNNGHGWDEIDSWAPPVTLVGSDGNPKGFMVDIDGDGILDVLTKASNGKPQGYYNRIRSNQGWASPAGVLASTFPASWGSLNFQGTDQVDTFIDINGDGLIDIVRRNNQPISPFNPSNVTVLLGTPNNGGWVASPNDYSMPGFSFNTSVNPVQFSFDDVNRDGLPDLIGQNSSPTLPAQVFLNAGTFIPGVGMWATSSDNVGASLPSYNPSDMHFSDVDGDGIADLIEEVQNPSRQFAVLFGTGSDYTANWAGAYTAAMQTYQLPVNAVPNRGYFATADINGDGLVDLIVPPLACQTACPSNNLAGGQLLINTTNGWVDPTPGMTFLANLTDAHSLPIMPAPNATFSGSQFVDLDGDGLVDLVQASDSTGSLVSQAWLNTFHRPIIIGFPNAQAAQTIVDYAVTTTAAAQGASSVYDDSAPIAPGLTNLAMPLRVVADVQVDAGLGPLGPKAVTKYHYTSMRGTNSGRGPQGFASVTSTDPLGTITVTRYSQSYPFTGLPTQTVKSYSVGDGGSAVQYAVSTTTYCAYLMNQPGTPPGPPPFPSCATSVQDMPSSTWFVYPAQVVETDTLESGTAADRTASNPYNTVTTTYTYDDRGNPTLTQVDTTLTTPLPNNQAPEVEEWLKTTQNDYGAEGSATQLLGRPNSTTVTNSQLQPAQFAQPAKSHLTTFTYGAVATSMDEVGGVPLSGIALSRTDSEAGTGYPVELVTAYAYDAFGNLVTTTACDNDFLDCAPNAPGPTGDPFRTSTVSYNPADFVAPSGSGLATSIGYQAGLFPVKKVNAMGHVEYLVHDARFGVLIQDTDPNGITTCYAYDFYGNKTAQKDRCGTPNYILTTYASYVPADPTAPYAATAVHLTSMVDGQTIWTYTDALGREVETLKRNFGGGLTETMTIYNVLGQLWSKSQPFNVGDPFYNTSFLYDGLNRVTQSTQVLGNLGGGAWSVATKTTAFQGTSVTSTETVGGTPEARTETRNAIGKVSQIADALGSVIFYSYDSDGNVLRITDTTLMNQTVNAYDNRGRKTSMNDPDMHGVSYGYDGFGDLVSERDALGQTTTMTYDALSRMTSRTDATGKAEWVYDNTNSGAAIGKLVAMISAPDSRLQGACSIPYVDATDGFRSGKAYYYDSLGQLQQVYECADGQGMVTSYQYDVLGRRTQITYPQVDGQALSVGYHYSNVGYLQYVSDASDGSVLWAATAQNALGQVTNEYTRNGVATVKTRNPSTGWLLGSTSTAQANNNQVIQGWTYVYDEAGDLTFRERLDQVSATNTNEFFGYDALNRLTTAVTVTGQGYEDSESYAYDLIGNMTTKGTNTLHYGRCSTGTFGPHAVCAVSDGSTFAYDLNGNMISGRNRLITYNPQNKVKHVESDPAVVQGNNSGSADFIYGADGNRVLQISVNNTTSPSTTSRTIYAGLAGTGKSMYERTTTGHSVQHVHYIYAGNAHGGNPFAIRVVTDDVSPSSSTSTKYYHYDHLGSVTAMSDEFGRVVTPTWGGPNATLLGYDAWGARRNPDGTAATASSFNLQPGHREFTGHETIPEVGLVNMNGRVYDPTLGRFLSPDPNLQSPYDMQSYNRYSYVLNNPLRYTDPTGYLSWGSVFNYVSDAYKLASVFLGVPCVSCITAALAMVGEAVYAAAAEGASWSQTISTLGTAAIGTYGGVVGTFTGLGADVEGLAHEASRIPIVGGTLEGVIATDPFTALPWALHDFGGWERPAEQGAITEAAMALTIMSGGLSTPLMIAADTGIGFAEGFSLAEVNGAGLDAALKAGAISGAIAGLSASVSALTEYFREDEWEARLTADPPQQVQEFTGLHSDVYGEVADPNASWASEDGWLGHSDFGHWVNDTGYSASHDGFVNNVINNITTDGSTINTILTIGTNAPFLYPSFYLFGMLSQNGGTAVLINDVYGH